MQHGEKIDGKNSCRVSVDTGRVSAREKKILVEGNPGSSKVDPLARAPLSDGPSVPRGFPNDAVTRPSSPPGAPAVVPSINLELSCSRRSPSEVLGPHISPSIWVSNVASYMLAVRKPLVPLVLSQASPVGRSLPRGFPGGLSAADGAASVFEGLMLAMGGRAKSFPVV